MFAKGLTHNVSEKSLTVATTLVKLQVWCENPGKEDDNIACLRSLGLELEQQRFKLSSGLLISILQK